MLGKRRRSGAYTATIGQQQRLEILSRDRDPDIPRRARIKGNYKSKIIELEVWLQENIFYLKNTPMSKQEKRDTELLIYGAAATMLAERYPRFKPVMDQYVSLMQKFNQQSNETIILQTNSSASQSLADLNVRLEELRQQIRELDRQFDVKSDQFSRLIKEINYKRLELENLKTLCRNGIVDDASY